ncbi:MAG: hypothetical protein OXF85_02860 [Candidatus Saccharibacteria bacterium]|nr:hypothetical protein [Candidatus Saccharibacteria bacterium]
MTCDTAKIKTSYMLDGSEASMIPILKQQAKKFYASAQSLEKATEFSAGRGIADLVIAKIDEKNLKKRKQLKVNALVKCNWHRQDHERFNVDKKTFQKINQLAIAQYIVAIECKVRDWRKGLLQAMRYRSFAHESYLVIYDCYKHLAVSNIHLFKMFNIGLGYITDDGDLQLYFRPQSKTPIYSNDFLLASERLYSLVDNFQQDFIIRNPLDQPQLLLA